MQTQKVVEMLLTKINTTQFKNSLKACRVLSDERNWYPKTHNELKNYINCFEKPIIICNINTIITCLIIETKPKSRLYPVISIIGNDSKFMNLSKSNIIKYIVELNKYDEFVPNSFYEQIYYFPYVEDEEFNCSDFVLIKQINKINEYVEGHVFTKIDTNVWTIDLNTCTPINKTKLKTTPRNIISNILKDI